MNDYTLKNDLDVEVIRKIDHAGAWAIAAGVGAYSSLLNGDIPLINIYDDELLTTPKATQKFANSLKSLDNGKKELLAFCDENYYQNCFYSIQKRGFTIKTFKKVPFTYYGYGSGGYLFDLYIQRDVLLSGNSEMSSSKPVTRKAMTEGALNPVILAENGVSTFRRDSLSCVNVKIKNTNPSPFLAINGPDGKPQFSISYRLLDEHKHPLALEGMRTPLIVDVQPLQEISLCAFIKTPVEPGSYILQFDLVQSSGLLIESKRSKNVDIAINVN